MPRTGFLNDNEYRAYPFVHKTSYAGADLPMSAIVDAGIIMGIDSAFEHAAHEIWLAAIERVNNTFRFTFDTDTPAAANLPLVFVCSVNADEWTTITAESDPVSSSCNRAPVWEGFLVIGELAALRAAIANNTTTTFPTKARLLEPGRVQSLVKSYVHAINIGNYSRIMALPPEDCQNDVPDTERDVITNAFCMQGNIRFKEGYNCRIKQTDRSNEISFTADVNAGDTDNTELCAHGGEVSLYLNEPFDAATGFYSGGPACDQMISTLNGVGGANVNIIAGTGITITTDAETHTVTIAPATNNLIGNCST
jgi:hypothetical protein